MRISFDLDDTLICRDADVPREPALPWLVRQVVGHEPLRSGAVALLQQLRRDGWELWVYTASQRPRWQVRQWLRWHGVVVADVVNDQTHRARCHPRATGEVPSKNPAAFGIDLHIDNSEGVRIEGERFGFAVVVVEPQDRAWTRKVIEAAKALASERGRRNC